MLRWRLTLLLTGALTPMLWAEPPSVSYIFPAGGQRGTTVNVRIGGHYLHDTAPWEMLGLGVKTSAQMVKTKRIWFEGPLIKQPASQQKEDYPQDYAATVEIAADAKLGSRAWRTWNAQGVTPAVPFVIGHLPEVVEQETDGEPIPASINLPVTVNGRIFPREDVDIWSFEAAAGQPITCSVEATGLISPAIDPQQRFEPQIEIRDAQGRAVEVNVLGLGLDPQVRFTPAVTGRYQVRIWDTRASGMQHFVYRLTVTSGPWIDAIFPLGGQRATETEVEVAGQGISGNRMKVRWPEVTPGLTRHAWEGMNAVLCDVDVLPEVIEAAELPPLPNPGIGNGRIEQPGDTDDWSFTASKAVPVRLEVRANRLGSPLDAVLVIKDAQGKELMRGEDLPNGSCDCELDFTPPTDGTFVAAVQERFASRGGRDFGYRLKVAPVAADFELAFANDALSALIGGEGKLPVLIERRGGFAGPVTLKVEGLPAGATCPELMVPGNQNRAELVIKLAKEVPVQLAKLTVTGYGMIGASMTERKAVVPWNSGDSPLDHVALACTLATPFKLKGQYEFRYVPRGGTLSKRFGVERNGYEGPLEVSLADRQGRHLQGVSGPTITVPPGSSEFEYTLHLPPWMELGRTSRTNLMVVGEVADAAGKQHKVSFSTAEQNEQLIALVSPAPLKLALDRSTMAVQAGSELKVPVHLHRQTGLSAATKLELIVPEHMRDISATAVEVPADQATAELKVTLGASPGPLNMPLMIRATTQHNGGPIVAEVRLEMLTK